MFVLCPHCQFLVSVDARTGRTPAACPKCGGALGAQDELQDVPASIAAEPEAPAPKADWSAPEPLPPPVAEHAPLSDAIATIVGHDDPPRVPPPSRADELIAAMSAKPARKPRAKPAEEEPKPAVKRARRTTKAATSASEPEPTPAAPPPPKPAPPSKPAREPLMPRIGAWLASKTKSEAKPEPKQAVEAKPATPNKPISLRERAAKRAAAKAAAETPAPIADVAPSIVAEPAPIAMPEPIVAAEPIIEVASPPAMPVVEAPVVEGPNVETPPIEAPVDTPDVIEPVVVEAPPPPPPAPTPVAPPPAVAVARPRATTTAPSFLRTRAHSALALPARWPHLAAIAALSLVLALQLLLAQRDVLAADARWRPVVGGACGVLRCSVPTWHQPEAFTMLSRDVRPHPRAPGTLRIDASFRNDARWAQAWPQLIVSLSDVDGRVVGTRAFTAREYLGAAPTQNVLAPGQTAAIQLDVIEPAPGIVAFSFDFR